VAPPARQGFLASLEVVYKDGVKRSPIKNLAECRRPASPVLVIAGLLGLAPAVAGCGGMPPPNDQLVASQAALRAAEEVGGASDPQAALHLKLAREQIEKAKALIQSQENDVAERLLKRAEADAELALALAKQRATQAEAEEAMKQVEQLKQAGAK
jgi:hypothetical protein